MLDFHLSWPQLFHFPRRKRGHRAVEKQWFSYHNHGALTKHKGWEIQLDHWGWHRIIDIEMRLSLSGEDHAGLHLEFGVFGFSVIFGINDSRHWDDSSNDWEKYDEQSVIQRESRWEESKREQVELAYLLVASDIRKKDAAVTETARLEWEASDEGKAELKRIAEERVRLLEKEKEEAYIAKKARGEEHRSRNLENHGE